MLETRVSIDSRGGSLIGKDGQSTRGIRYTWMPWNVSRHMSTMSTVGGLRRTVVVVLAPDSLVRAGDRYQVALSEVKSKVPLMQRILTRIASGRSLASGRGASIATVRITLRHGISCSLVERSF